MADTRPAELFQHPARDWDREKAARYERLHRLERVSARCTAAHVENVTATAGRSEWDEPYPWGACIVGVLTICAVIWTGAAWLLGVWP